MAAQRRIDLVLDSVKRLLRIGATANLLNLLQKQHPADLAQIFSELPDKDREAAFSLLAERNGRLAMEGISELGPEAGAALLATRSAEEIAKLATLVKMSVEDFEEEYVRRVGVRKSLIEYENGDCAFFDNKSRKCTVYSARPRQCRTWPFWPENRESKRAWITAKKLTPCPGMDNGKAVGRHVPVLSNLIQLAEDVQGFVSFACGRITVSQVCQRIRIVVQFNRSLIFSERLTRKTLHFISQAQKPVRQVPVLIQLDCLAVLLDGLVVLPRIQVRKSQGMIDN